MQLPQQQLYVFPIFFLKHTLALLRRQEVEALLEGQTLLGELVVGGEAGCGGVWWERGGRVGWG